MAGDDIVARLPKDIVKELHIRAAIEQISGTLFERAANEIEQLRKERDEARRMWCELMAANTAAHREQVANRHGWDCFKEASDER